jgi:hypothetical protein
MHEMPVIPQSGPQMSGYPNPGSMPQPNYGMPGGPYMPPVSGLQGVAYPSYLPAYNGYMPSDPAMYAGSAPPPPTPPLQTEQQNPHP